MYKLTSKHLRHKVETFSIVLKQQRLKGRHTLQRFIAILIIFLPLLMSAQTFNATQLADCIGAKFENNLFTEKGFRYVYGGPRKERGSLYLYHHAKHREYLFVYANDSGQVTNFQYYLPDKATYNRFLNTKLTKVVVSGSGRVHYEDGKIYYQVGMRRE